MKYYRLIGFAIIFSLSLVSGMWWIAVPLWFVGTWWLGAHIILVVAVATDAYLGAFFSVPIISLIAIVWYGACVSLQPLLQPRLTI